MHLSPRSYRRAGCCFLALTIVLLNGPSGFTQAPQTEQRFPTQDNPRVVISNASTISITSWDKNEVSIRGSVLGAQVQAGEITIKPDKNKLEISCHPSKPDRDIALNLQVPVKAVLEMNTGGNTIQVKEPQGQITIRASRGLLQLLLPEYSSLDMQAAPHASVRRRIGQGVATIGVGRSRMGIGPPYVKVTAATTQVVAVLGSPEALTQPTITRPMTRAAQSIARRGGSMSQALRKSTPQLIRPASRIDNAVPAAPKNGEEGALKLETYLVNLNVGATDRAGRAVGDLKQDDFSVYEDGVLQRLSFFSPQKSQFNVVLLIDLSGSMREQIDLIIETAHHFLDVAGAQDSVAVVTFTTDVTVVSHLTKDRDDLRENISDMLAPAGGTAFYDALGYALVEELRKVKGQRNAVITITDGEDNALQAQLLQALLPDMRFSSVASGSFLTFEQLLDGVMEADALIYPIHFDPAEPQLLNPGPPPRKPTPMSQIQPQMTAIARKQLQSLADASGGRFFHADRIEDLKGVFEQVAAELRTVYSMAYTPKDLNFDGRFRRIRVQVNRPDVAIRTRPGYFGR
jgi:Ca-activated chloride channel family protein